MKKFISFSGGVESTTMCILYGKGATAIFCDTGSEHKAMYDRMIDVYDKIRRIHHDFYLKVITPKVKAKGVEVITLEEYCLQYKVMPSGQMRFCTREFKIIPIDNFLKEQGECELMIGLNADEENSREGNWGLNENVKYSYPLIDDGLTRDDCETLLREHDLHPNFPVYMSRGGCRMCFFKSEKEYRAMYHLNKDEFKEVMAFEEQIQDKRKIFYSIMGNGKSLRQLMFEEQNERLKFPEIEALYKSLKKETSCGPFCHR